MASMVLAGAVLGPPNVLGLAEPPPALGHRQSRIGTAMGAGFALGSSLALFVATHLNLRALGTRCSRFSPDSAGLSDCWAQAHVQMNLAYAGTALAGAGIVLAGTSGGLFGRHRAVRDTLRGAKRRPVKPAIDIGAALLCGGTAAIVSSVAVAINGPAGDVGPLTWRGGIGMLDRTLLGLGAIVATASAAAMGFGLGYRRHHRRWTRLSLLPGADGVGKGSLACDGVAGGGRRAPLVGRDELNGVSLGHGQRAHAR